MFFHLKAFGHLISLVFIALAIISCSDNSPKKFISSSEEERIQFEFALASAEQGDAQNQYLVAQFYEKGQGINHNYQQAINWYKKAAQQNNVEAQYALGNLYKTGREKVILADAARAAFWFQRAATQQHVLAQYELARLYHYGAPGFEKNGKKASIWYEMAAQQNDVSAQYDLGFMYYVGHDIEKDIKQGMFWLQKAADNNHLHAQWLLGKIYLEDSNVNPNFSNAFSLFEKAAKQNHADAQFELSRLYQNGKGVAKDEVKARYWLEMSAKNNCIDALAEQGDAFAQYLLGSSYLDGKKLFKPQSDQKAFHWIYQSANQGYSGAQYRLASMYQYGQGQKIDLNEARYWLEQAVNSFPVFEKAKQGDDFAQLLLGKVYALGTKTYKWNEAQAIKWFEKSAEKGNVEAQYELALVYLNSTKGKEVNDNALFWLNESAQNGYVPAQKMLKKLNQPALL